MSIIRELLFSTHTTYTSDSTELFRIIAAEDVPALKEYFQKYTEYKYSPELNMPSCYRPFLGSFIDSITPLGLAVYLQNVELASILVSHGADIGQCFTDSPQTVLYFAIKRGNKEIVEFIINHKNLTKEIIDRQDEYENNTVLHLLTEKVTNGQKEWSMEFIDSLLHVLEDKKHANTQIKNNLGFMPYDNISSIAPIVIRAQKAAAASISDAQLQEIAKNAIDDTVKNVVDC